jgi:Ca2+-transporting ATPase
MSRRPVPLVRLKELIPSTRGLSASEVEVRRQEYGPNDILEMPPHPWWDLLRDAAKDPMLWFFIGVGLLYAGTGQRTEALTLLVAIFPLLGMDLYLHRRTQASTAGLKTRLAATVNVLRDDAVETIPALDLVPGDLAIVPPGEPFPADGLVVDGTGLQVDESALTGEAYPVPKRPLGLLPRASADPLVEEEHWVFAGTRLLTSEARVRITHTGGETVYGEIVRSAIHGRHEITPLQAAIGRLVKILIVAAIIVCFALAAVRLYQGHGWLDALISAVTLATAAIPEEFPVVFSFFLGVGVYRMATRQALARHAVTVENIGRVSYVCSDKTGTITEGRLQLEHLVPSQPLDENRLLFLASLASRNDSGDPMDEAILAAAEARGIAATCRETVETFPFTEDRKRESAIVKTHDGRLLVATKGAAEVIVAMSTLDTPGRAFWHSELSALAEGAHKVIAVASRAADGLPASGGEPDAGFEFAGLLAFEDPVREGVRDAVQECMSAGIHTVMITGDHPKTALAVARSVGIGGATPRLIMGEELEEKVALQNDDGFRGVDVISRARPAQKLMLVKSFQARGEIVAVTGDGVNDVPALQAADVGVAMGERGTRSAREVAAIVLLDDNFRTIVAAIREGRQLFQNLRSSFAYLLMIHIPFVMTATLIPLAGYPLLYLPVHIVWLEIMIHPTAMLAFQAPADRVLARQPHTTGRARFFGPGEWAVIVLTGIVISALVTAGYLRSLEGVGNVEHGRAMALATFTVGGACAAAALSRLGTSASRVIVIGTILSSLVMIQAPRMNRLLHLQALHRDDWALVALAGLIVGGLPFLLARFGSRIKPPVS